MPDAKPAENPAPELDKDGLTPDQHKFGAEVVRPELIKYERDIKGKVKVKVGNEALRDVVTRKLAANLPLRKLGEKILKKQEKSEREKLFQDTMKDTDRYMQAIEALLANPNLTEQNMTDLLALADALPAAMSLTEKDQELFRRCINGVRLSPEDISRVADLMVPSKTKYDAFKASPVGAMFAMIAPDQRMEVGRRVIDKNPGSIKDWIETFTVSGTLTMAQGQELWAYARAKELTAGDFDIKALEDRKARLEKLVRNKTRWITEGDQTNPILKAFNYPNLAAVGGVIWGALVTLLSGAAAWKDGDLETFLTNPWSYAGFGAIAGGVHHIAGKWPLEDTLRQKPGDERAKEGIAKGEREIMRLLSANPMLAKYLSRGGYAVARLTLQENFEKKKAKSFTYEDLFAHEKGPDQLALLKTLQKDYPSALESLNQITNMAVILNWPFDTAHPEQSQLAFNEFYDKKYKKAYGLQA